MATTLTREQIAAMDAGRDMDAIVAEHVMGWKRPPGPSLPGTIDEWEEHDHDKNGCCLNVMNMRTRQVATFSEWCDAFIWPGNGGRVHRYSTDIAAAWEVMNWLREAFTNVGLFADNGWGCTAWNIGSNSIGRDITGPVNSLTAPLAICRTALLATLE